MSDPLHLQAITASLRGMFPAGVATAAEIIAVGPDDLWPEERSAVIGAVPARLAEFRAGRSAARRALASLGLPPVALPMGRDRAPVWPQGVVGSIAHAGGFAIAVASRDRLVGIDIEPDAELAPDLWSTICNDAELRRLPEADRGRHVLRAFAAKEAVFKAQAPKSRAMFGYDVVEVTLADTAFEAHFQRDAGAFRAGLRLRGALVAVQGIILAGAVV